MNGRSRFATAIAVIGATVVASALLSVRPSAEATPGQHGAAATSATPNVLLAALARSGRDPYSSYYASFLAPTDAPTAVAGLVNEYRAAVAAQVAGAANGVRLPLWALGLNGVGGSAAGAAAGVDATLGGPAGAAIAAAGLAQVFNQLGPLGLDLGNIGIVAFSQNPDPTAPSGSRPDFNASDLASWRVGLGDLGGTTGTIGWILNNTFGSGDGGIADATGLLQTANRFGPAVFNLSVLKYIAFIQPPNGTTLPNGQLDAIRAVDIGQWSAGIPGLLYNTGTTGFVTNYSYGTGLGAADFIGGLQTTLYVGPFSFTFSFLPSIGFPTFPSLTLAPPTSTVTTLAADVPAIDVKDADAGTDVVVGEPGPSPLRQSRQLSTVEPSQDPTTVDHPLSDPTGPTEDHGPSLATVAPTPETQEAASVPEEPVVTSAPTPTPTPQQPPAVETVASGTPPVQTGSSTAGPLTPVGSQTEGTNTAGAQSNSTRTTTGTDDGPTGTSRTTTNGTRTTVGGADGDGTGTGTSGSYAGRHRAGDDTGGSRNGGNTGDGAGQKGGEKSKDSGSDSGSTE